jgi:hypothetical protein
MIDQNSTTANDSIERGHEPDAVNSRLVVLSGGGLVLLVALVLLLMFGTLRFLKFEEQTGRAPSRVPAMEMTVEVPLSADLPAELRQLRQSEEQQLNQYRWIDRRDGIAKIPIDRAMEIVAKNGLAPASSESEETSDNQSNR